MNIMTRSRVIYQEKITGGLLGLLIGDALGVPYEFHEAKDIPPTEQINYVPPLNFVRAHQGVPPATWSDDGAQALCLLASLLYCKKLNLADFANRLVNWYEYGYMAIDGVVYDAGITTAKVLTELRKGADPYSSGLTNQYSNGNGALMRVLPLAIWHRGTDTELVKDAQMQSLVTHGHLRSQVCCALYCLVARCVIESHATPWQNAVHILRSIYAYNSEAQKELEYHIRPDEDIPATGSGYVVDSLRAVKEALSIKSYQEAVRYAISLGKDTDTTACIVGGVIGLRDTVNGIPLSWRNDLRGKELYQPLLKQLIERMVG